MKKVIAASESELILSQNGVQQTERNVLYIRLLHLQSPISVE